MTLRAVSFGGGMQSTGLLVLAAQGKIDYKTFIFCNVGEDSEHPDTLRYVHEIAMPYAEKHGIALIELRKHLKDGSVDTLYGRLTRPGSRSIGIPVHMASSGAPANRACTIDFKIKIVDKWLREHGAKEEKAVVAIGISLDEFQRMKPNLDPATMEWKQNAFPLIDLRMTRQDCINVIEQAGLPVPPRSACFFCPYHSLQKWQDMRQNEPELFQKSVDLEKLINERRAEHGLDAIRFARKLVPLEQATTDLKQASLFDEDPGCDSGYCFL
jgi:hypothetical protein